METFEKLLAEKIAKGSDGVPESVVAAVDRNGNLIYSKSAGYNCVSPGAVPIDNDATFWIASCTKLVTTIAILQCVERGQIDLNAEVAEHIPELIKPEIISNSQSGDDAPFRLVPATKAVTLHHLLTHTSGIAYDLFQPTLMAWRDSRGEPPLALSGKVVEAYSTPLQFEPGQGWLYGGGVDWAGVLVSRLNGGISLEEYMQEHIFRPLGMASTTFRLEQHPNVRSRLVNMSLRADGGLVPGESPFPVPARDDVGGAGLYSSVSDYTRLLGDLIKARPTLLKKKTVDQMFRPQLLTGSDSHSSLLANGDIIQSMTAMGKFTGGINFGLGGVLCVQDQGRMRRGTLAWGGMPNMVWFANRDIGVAGLYATQLLPPGDADSTGLAYQFIDGAFRIASS